MPLKVLSWKAPFLSTQVSFPPQLIDSKHPDLPNMMKEVKLAHVCCWAGLVRKSKPWVNLEARIGCHERAGY